MFVCFAPLYFVYGSVVPREFSLFERLMSLLYALFFVFFLPFFAAFRSKVWINWGLAAYGVLIYLPKFFYPAEAVLTAEDPSFTKMLLAICLRGIYGMMQAPFAALSSLIGDKAAASLVYWILPLALFWPFVMKVFRFYRRAYLSEQLNPMPKVKPVAAAAHTGPAVKPEVLGTVITAPVVAASPDEVKGKAALAQNKKESAEALPGEKEEAVALPGEEKEEAIALSAPEPKPESKPESKPEVIELSAPAAPVISPAIAPVEPEDSASGTVIELGAPPASSGTDSDSGHSDV